MMPAYSHNLRLLSLSTLLYPHNLQFHSLSVLLYQHNLRFPPHSVLLYTHIRSFLHLVCYSIHISAVFST